MPSAATAENFPDFCRDTFGVKHEPLTTHLPGDAAKILPDGAWNHVSENSATIASETSLPVVSHLEYGPTAELGQKTAPTDRAYYIHVHRLTGLKPGETYHYRVVGTDERGNKVESAVNSFTTEKVKGAIYLPNPAQPNAPFRLDQADKTYVLTEDVVAPGVAFSIVATGITLDLNGHTVTYNDDPNVGPDADAQREFGFIATQGVQGVRCSYGTRGSARLLNGTIRQGKGNGAYGSVPVMFRGEEIAGVTIEYHGSQVSGIHNETKRVHHNVINDLGSELSNRHQGVDAIGGASEVHHNLIQRARQRAVNAISGSKVYRNEIYVDSCTTNSFGVMCYKTTKATVTENRIFGRGYLMIGIGTVSDGVADIKVSRNFIHVQSHKPDERWAEYGAQSGAYGVRVTWGGKNIEYADNVIVSRGRDGGMVRGVWYCPTPKIENVTFKRNLIKVEVENDASDRWGAIVISGENTPEALPGLFEGNTVWSNFCHVRLGEEYGTGVNARFVNNTFIRTGNDPRYATVICGYHNFNNEGSVFLDTKLEGGASFDKVKWEGTGRNNFKVGRVVEGADVIDKVHSPSPASAEVK